MKEIIKYILYGFAVIYLFNLLCCGNSHPCIGEWHGSYARLRDPSVRESWDIIINEDGTCIAREIGSGSANYEENYTGTWEMVSEDIIYMDMSSEPSERKVTYSISEINSSLKNAETGWEELQAMNKMNKHKTIYSRMAKMLYLRSDGAMSSHRDCLNNPDCYMTKINN